MDPAQKNEHQYAADSIGQKLRQIYGPHRDVSHHIGGGFLCQFRRMVLVEKSHGLMNQLVKALQIYPCYKPAALKRQIILIPVIAECHQYGNPAEGKYAQNHLAALPCRNVYVNHRRHHHHRNQGNGLNQQ